MFNNRVNLFLLFSTIAAALISLSFFYESKSEERLWNKTSKELNIKKRNEILDWQKIKPIRIKSNNINIKKDTYLKWKREDDLFENSSYEWKKTTKEFDIKQNKPIESRIISLNTLNRSIVFNNMKVGPDVSFLVPPAFLWSTRYTFDSTIRGHNRRDKGEKFIGWNKGDAVGQFHFQPINNLDRSFGINFGIRSVYKGQRAGGGSPVGEGQSIGFRYDKKLPNNSGFSFGAEQLIHFDSKTDTGRDIYLTYSKGWWRNPESYNPFPLYVGSFGIGTGKMAEGNIKGLCSDLFDGSGTEVSNFRRLCWAPIFSIARVENEKFSTFFEYNSKWFLLGSSLAPFENVPIRGTFAVQLSDHIENYKLNNFENMKWIFRLSYGF